MVILDKKNIGIALIKGEGVGGGRVAAEGGCMSSECHGLLTCKVQGRMARDIHNFNIRVSVSLCIGMIYK